LNKFQIYIATLLATLITALPASAEKETSEDDWQLVINFPMIWATDISGEIDSNGNTTEMDVSFSDIVDKLDVGFMGEVYLTKGDWGVAWRTSYLSVKDSNTVPGVPALNPNNPPLIPKSKIDSTYDLLLNDLLVDYRINENFGIYTGLRRAGSRVKIKIEALEEGQHPLESPPKLDEDLDDWIAGVRLNYDLSDSWSTTLEMDTLLSGDNDTDRQFNAFVSYRVNHRHSAWFGYRYLKLVYITKTEGSRVESDFVQKGPTLGWAFTF
jgi:opacity protein-like surface antigen